MPELTDRDAFKIMMEYYHRRLGFPIKPAVKLVNELVKSDVDGLVQFAYRQAVLDTKGEE